MADKNKMYRVSPIKNGDYYDIEYSSDGGKTWQYMDTAPTQEEASEVVKKLEKGFTLKQSRGLIRIEKKNINPSELLSPIEDIPTDDDSDQNKNTKNGKETSDFKKKLKDNITNLLKSTPTNGTAVDIPTSKPVEDTPTKEEVNREIEDLKNGKTSSLTPKQEADKVQFNETMKKFLADLHAELQDPTLREKQEARKNLVQKLNNRNSLTQYEIDHPNFTENNKNTPKSGGSASTAVPTTEVINGSATNDNIPKKSSYWTNFLYGNDIGSVQNDKEAKAEKEQKMDNFIKNNPTLIRSIFGKNSGLNFGERVARLGEMMAMIGADATKGAYAGFNHQALPEATKGRYSEIYNNALSNQYARRQGVFESENKANIDKANRISILRSSPILSKLDDDMISKLADKIVTGIAGEEWNNYENELQKKGYTPLEIEEIKSTFDTLRNTFSDITTQRGNVVELNGKEFDLMRKPQQAIAELNKQKVELKKMLTEVDSLKFDQLSKFMTNFKSIYAGVHTVSNYLSENKEFGYNVSANVSGGIPVVKGSASGSVNSGKGSNKSTGTNTDELALEGLAAGKTTAEEWNKETSASREALRASIQAAIDEIQSQIDALKKFHSIDDGIVKAPHMKQWLVREDGTRIALNPSDSIYATKNKLTTKKDNKSENIVPMEKEDKVVVIQKKLGHNCDKRIIKNNDYYLSKLK